MPNCKHKATSALRPCVVIHIGDGKRVQHISDRNTCMLRAASKSRGGTKDGTDLQTRRDDEIQCTNTAIPKAPKTNYKNGFLKTKLHMGDHR